MDIPASAKARKPRFRRPRFREGQLLTAHMLNVQQADSIERLRLLVRAMFGHGVVFGYALEKVSPDCLALSPGLALDRHGRELFWPGGRLGLADVVGQVPSKPGTYSLLVHYAEHYAGGDLPSYCEKDDIDWIEQGVVFSLAEGCKHQDCCDCPENESDVCLDLCTFVCARTGSVAGPVPAAPDLDHAAEKPAALCPATTPGWHYDPRAGIAIACVDVTVNPSKQKECDPDLIFCETPVDVCDTRPFAYRNPLLFELIKGCHLDLARVNRLGSWHDWFVDGMTKEVAWAEFRDGICRSGGFIIEFSRPVRIDSLNRASIRLTATSRKEQGGYWETGGIPLDVIEPCDSGAEPDCTRQVRLIIEDKWIDKQLKDRCAKIRDGALIELTIRGALVRDCCGQVLDARPLGLAKEQCAPAMPGDDFVAVFWVAPEPVETSGSAGPPVGTSPSASE